MIECIIFDCDGTLVDSEPLSNLALELTLRDSGVIESAASLLDEFKGWQLANVCATIEARHAVRLRPSFVADYRALVLELFARDLQPIAGVHDMLQRISLPRCVASSGPPDKIAQSLAVTGLQAYFGDHVFSSYVVKSWKPESGLFLHAARTMGFAPRSCAVVEDSDVGIEAALRAGMRAFRYCENGSIRSAPHVVEFGHMHDLPGLLGVSL